MVMSQPMLTLGLIGTSNKENEHRVLVHPAHLELLDEGTRKRLIFETGYGEPFGVRDDDLRALGASIESRSALFEVCDVVANFKPMEADFEAVKRGGILWGCAHFAQQKTFTQTSIDRRLTVISVESMDIWSERGERVMHAFQKMSELGGYAGVLDALHTRGIDGRYGPRRKCIVVGFGSAGRGAVHALQGLGFRDIDVFTIRHPHKVTNQIPGVEYNHVQIDEVGHMVIANPDGSRRRFVDELVTADIIVNAMLQDPDNPKMIIAADEMDQQLKPGSIIIDASCDEGMGFPFARPTTFDDPIFQVGRAFYYSVDHTPSSLWDSASWEMSRRLIHYVPLVMGGPQSWDRNETVRRAIEIRDGIIKNPKIISFQKREPEYPHRVIRA